MTIQDYDLSACLKYNPQDTFVLEDIAEIKAVWEGENDGDNWHWFLVLNDGRNVFLEGGCDYTGWDCQSWASHQFVDSVETLDQILSKLDERVRISLQTQLIAGKNETWREKMIKEFGF